MTCYYMVFIAHSNHAKETWSSQIGGCESSWQLYIWFDVHFGGTGLRGRLYLLLLLSLLFLLGRKSQWRRGGGYSGASTLRLGCNSVGTASPNCLQRSLSLSAAKISARAAAITSASWAGMPENISQIIPLVS